MTTLSLLMSKRTYPWNDDWYWQREITCTAMMWCLMWRLTATQQRVDYSDLETIKCRIFSVASISKLYHARRVFPIDISIIHSFLQHNYEEKNNFGNSSWSCNATMCHCFMTSKAHQPADSGNTTRWYRWWWWKMARWLRRSCTSEFGLSFQWGDKMLNSSVVNEILINFIKFYIRESFQFHRSSHVISNRFASPRDARLGC